MKATRRLLVIVLVIVTVFTMTACGSGGNSSETQTPPADGSSEAEGAGTPTPGGAINLQLDDTSQPFGLPWYNADGSGRAFQLALEGMGYQSIDGSIEPWLAESWEVQLDQKRVVYKLRQGIKFHDGSDFNADAVQWNIQQWLDHHVLNPNIGGAEVLGDYEVAILFERFSPTILSAMAAQVRMVSKENYENNGEEYAQMNVCGTGPFKIVSYTPGGQAVFEKNENYWREGEPYLDDITIPNVMDEMAQTLAMQTEGPSGLDIMLSSRAEQMKTLKDSMGDKVNIVQTPNGAVTIFPSSANPDSPFSKLEVRQALNYAVDREALMAAFGFGFLTPAYQFIPEMYNGHISDTSVELPKTDKTKAKELLAQAGYPNGFTTKLIGEYGIVSQDFVTALASQLAEVGITCEMEFPTQAASNDYRMTGGYEGILVCRLTVFTDIELTYMLMGMDPTNLDMFYPATWRPSTDEAKDLYTKISSDETRNPEYSMALQKMQLENVVNVPLYFTSEFIVMKSDIRGGGFGTYAGGQDMMPSTIQREQ
jgi:peptide/nickel transport system substrate-binding protein